MAAVRAAMTAGPDLLRGTRWVAPPLVISTTKSHSERVEPILVQGRPVSGGLVGFQNSMSARVRQTETGTQRATASSNAALNVGTWCWCIDPENVLFFVGHRND